MKREEIKAIIYYTSICKGDGFMEMLEKLNESIQYIESNLNGEIQY